MLRELKRKHTHTFLGGPHGNRTRSTDVQIISHSDRKLHYLQRGGSRLDKVIALNHLFGETLILKMRF
jgi:hypothetical protein